LGLLSCGRDNTTGEEWRQIAVDIIHYIAVPKAQEATALLFEESCALGVVFFLVEVLTAIQLDDQFLARGAEVGDVRPNGMLAAEMDSIGALSAQICLQLGFGRGLLSKQFARAVHHLRRGALGFLYGLLLPDPSQPPPFSPHRERGASGRKMGEE